MTQRTPPLPMIAGIPDPVLEGIAAGWDVTDATEIAHGSILEADVVIIGTGAGGGTSAEILAESGLRVLMLEEGPLKSTNDFDMQEASAYHDLYQENAGRMSKDGAISILQGRCVGGTTVINWTSSFRTPEQTLNYWRDNFGVKSASKAEMAPWFETMETRLNISDWVIPPNENNAVLSRGSEKLGYHWKVIPRNVAGCWNTGYCGTGCPTNAKQSMLVTTIPAALNQNSGLIYSARAERLLFDGSKVIGVEVTALDGDYQPSGTGFTVTAPRFVMSCGGINGPALLKRSKAPDPENRVGKRTFLHPVAFSFAEFENYVDPFYGAPQSIYSDHFQWLNVSGPAGYKLEATPLHPGLAGVLFMGHGKSHFENMSRLANTNLLLALIRDGFDDDSPGASIDIASDGSPIVDYPVNEYIWEAFQRAMITMAEVQFAAGAQKVRPAHMDAPWYGSIDEARSGIMNLEFRSNAFVVGSAHVMGGLAMGEDKRQCVVDSNGKYHYLDNLYVFDGSIFPTSIGANPQLSVYGFSCRLANQLAKKISEGTA